MLQHVLEDQRVEVNLDAGGRIARTYRLSLGASGSRSVTLPRLAAVGRAEDVRVVADGIPRERVPSPSGDQSEIVVMLTKDEAKASTHSVVLFAPLQEVPVSHPARYAPLVLLPAARIAVELRGQHDQERSWAKIVLPVQLTANRMTAVLELPPFADELAAVTSPSDDPDLARIHITEQLIRLDQELNPFVADEVMLDRRAKRWVKDALKQIHELQFKMGNATASLADVHAGLAALTKTLPKALAVAVELTGDGVGKFVPKHRSLPVKTVGVAYSQSRHTYLKRASRAGLLAMSSLLLFLVSDAIGDLGAEELNKSREVATNILLFLPALMLAEFVALRPRPTAVRRAEGPFYSFLSMGFLVPIVCALLLVGRRDPDMIAAVMRGGGFAVMALSIVAFFSTSTAVLAASRWVVERAYLRRANLEHLGRKAT